MAGGAGIAPGIGSAAAGTQAATQAGTGDTRTFTFSTDAFREHERIAAWREVFGRTLLHLDFFPRSKEDFHAAASIFRSPSLRVLQASTTVAYQGIPAD